MYEFRIIAILKDENSAEHVSNIFFSNFNTQSNIFIKDNHIKMRIVFEEPQLKVIKVFL